MTDPHLPTSARRFIDKWRGRGYEKGESQVFWLELLREVLGVDRPGDIITFENQVKLSSTSFIDAYIQPTRVLIEQKGLDKDLRKPIRQSDGTLLTPFQQAKRYAAELPYSLRPRWVVACNFSSFLIYDMEHPQGEPEEVLLEDLEREAYRLRFLVDTGDSHIHREMEVSIAAGELVGLLYEGLRGQYLRPDAPETLRSLNVLCVRLVFCLYAEDAEVFGRHGLFHDYLAQFPPGRMRAALLRLFEVLDTRPEERDPYLAQEDPLLASFPYVNGGLFADRQVEVPPLNAAIADLLLVKASDDFDWSQISPTIFGAVFESTLNPETRRKGGMHYTSIENIHRVIDPLFLDSLRAELEQIQQKKVERQRVQALRAFQERLASLRFLDPACGSGNFLTETYLSLRRLENDVIRLQTGDQLYMGGMVNPIRVSIHQFYGIEINDFAVTVATTALWIAEAQMMAETRRIVQMDLDFLPLKPYHNIKEGNALRMDWAELCPKEELGYIMGNPPFVGYSLQSASQKEDITNTYKDENGKTYKTAGKIDYVSGWYYKAAQLMQGTPIRTAFVSTNSITQGEQVASVWQPLFQLFGIHIDFAHRTFRWDSEANLKAHVHCVIIGFSHRLNAVKMIYDHGIQKEAKNINPYLVDADNIFVGSRKKPLCDVPEMINGNRPTDNGNLIIEANDYEGFIKNEPAAKAYIHPLVGAEEFINDKKRYCLWLVGVSPAELRKMPLVMKRIEAVREMRLASSKEATRKCADTPALFQEIRQPIGNFIIVPSVSSEKRQYIPLGFMNSDTIPTNLVYIIPSATPYHFGILTSNVHMAWMRAVCGRLEMRYRYSKDIVYNNFPWPEATEARQAKIAATARAILDARALYPGSSLADLYDEVAMPPELRRAHQANDRAVMEAYGFPVKDFTEQDCVARLLELYRKMTQGL